MGFVRGGVGFWRGGGVLEGRGWGFGGEGVGFVRGGGGVCKGRGWG